MFEEGVVLNQTYQIIGHIGSGGGADVYRARHLRLKKDVAIKKIKNDILQKIDIRAEADIMKQLRHQYLPQVFDFIERGDDVYTVMDYIEGKTIGELLSYGLPLPEKQVTKWGIELCEAVRYLHEHKPSILHGDIKPSNIMLTMDEHICLIDFNISLIGAGEESVASGFSPGFSAPEISTREWLADASTYSITGSGTLTPLGKGGRPLVWSQKSKIDARSDIYSIGATLYCMVFGHGVRYLENGKPDFDNNGFRVRRGLEYAINKAMNPDSEQRFQSVQEMLNVLHNIDKYDADHIRRVFLRNMVIFTTVGVLIFGGIFGVKTVRDIRSQMETKYQQAIQEMYYDCENGDIEQAEKILDEIKESGENRVETATAEAVLDYFKGDYDVCIGHVNVTLIQAENEQNTDYMGMLYFLKGESYFMQEDYKMAVEAFSQAEKYITKNAEYYRDYAIALARIGDNDSNLKAMSILEKADKNGLDSASTSLVKAEIEATQGNRKSAKNDFEQALESTEDNELKKQIYSGYAKMYESLIDDGDDRFVDDMIGVLERGIKDDNLSEALNLRELLGKAYSIKAKGDFNDKEVEEYTLKAVDEFQYLIDSGYTRFYIYDNIVQLYQNAGMYEEAENELELLEEKYPDDYRVYMQKAFLLAEIEDTKDTDERDYYNFARAYEKAEKLYSENEDKADGNSDAQMKMLDGMYQEMKEGHWLD